MMWPRWLVRRRTEIWRERVRLQRKALQSAIGHGDVAAELRYEAMLTRSLVRHHRWIRRARRGRAT